MTPLPGAAREVNGIANALGKKGVSAFTEDEASEAVYKKEASHFRRLIESYSDRVREDDGFELRRLRSDRLNMP
jgi:hypothetical protein